MRGSAGRAIERKWSAGQRYGAATKYPGANGVRPAVGPKSLRPVMGPNTVGPRPSAVRPYERRAPSDATPYEPARLLPREDSPNYALTAPAAMPRRTSRSCSLCWVKESSFSRPFGKFVSVAPTQISGPNFGAQLSECGSLLPLSLPLTGQRSGVRRDESRQAKAASSRRTPRGLWQIHFHCKGGATLATDLPLWLHRWDGPRGYPDIR